MDEAAKAFEEFGRRVAEVMEKFACPECGEREVDKLGHLNDNLVRCETCGAEYNPLTGEVVLEARGHNVALVILSQTKGE